MTGVILKRLVASVAWSRFYLRKDKTQTVVLERSLASYFGIRFTLTASVANAEITRAHSAPTPGNRASAFRTCWFSIQELDLNRDEAKDCQLATGSVSSKALLGKLRGIRPNQFSVARVADPELFGTGLGEAGYNQAVASFKVCAPHEINSRSRETTQTEHCPCILCFFASRETASHALYS